MNRELWGRNFFSKSEPINYPCPNCDQGQLEFKELNSEISATGRIQDYYGYDDGVDYSFSLHLTCNNKDCLEEVFAIGNGLRYHSVDENPETGELEETGEINYHPNYFYPNLQMIEIFEEVPSPVRKQIRLAFSQFHCDLSSCANKMRSAIELILDDLKAPRKRKTRKGMQPFNNLHDRIEHFGKSKKKISDLLMALKIIGNEGSHVGGLNKADILDAFEFLEIILEFTYLNNREKIFNKAKAIRLNKAPNSRVA